MGVKFEFDRKQYAENYDKIRLTDSQKNLLMSHMQTVAGTEEKRVCNQSTLKLWTRAVAAVLTLAIIGGAFYFLSGTGENSFTIVAGAAETGNSEVIIKSDLIAGTFAPSNFEYKDSEIYSSDKYGYDWFEYFSLSELSIKGKNIDTVTFKANKDFTYFALFPTGEKDRSSDEKQAPYKSEDFYEAVEKSYEHIMPFTHSHYREKNVEKEPYAAAAYGKMCDGFVYKNPNNDGGEKTISLEDSMYFCLETDKTDVSVDSCADAMNECLKNNDEVMKNRLESINTGDEYALTDEETQNLQKFDEYRKNLLNIMLDGATIDVTVRFNDGTEQTKVIELAYKGVHNDQLSVSVKAV